MDTFLENLAEALNHPDADLSPEQKLRDLPNWDSLAILTTLSMVDEQYGVTLSGADLQACSTVEDLFRRVSTERTGAA